MAFRVTWASNAVDVRRRGTCNAMRFAESIQDTLALGHQPQEDPLGGEGINCEAGVMEERRRGGAGRATPENERDRRSWRSASAVNQENVSGGNWGSSRTLSSLGAPRKPLPGHSVSLSRQSS